jgi:hypothetical protein
MTTGYLPLAGSCNVDEEPMRTPLGGQFAETANVYGLAGI